MKNNTIVKHKLGELVYSKVSGIGWITKINKGGSSKPYYVEWTKPTSSFLRDLEYYSEINITLMKDALEKEVIWVATQENLKQFGRRR